MHGSLVDQATEFALRAHAGQTRKASHVPYVMHPVGVALLLAAAGCDDEVIAAGLLHDTLEDCGISLDQLQDQFGERVAAIVAGCSEPDKSLAWEARKEHTLAHLRTAPLAVRLVTAADKLHNLRTIRADHAVQGDQVWSRFNRGREKQEWYYRSILAALQAGLAPGAYPSLVGALAQEVELLFGRS